MGNELSVPEVTENQENELSAEDAKYASEPVCLQNGSITMNHVQTVSLQKNDVVDTSADMKQNNEAPSSQKTMEIISISEENGTIPGSEAKPSAPATRSFFKITFSRSAPGRTKQPAGDSAAAAETSDANSATLLVNNAPSESGKSPETAVQEGLDKGPNQTLNSPLLSVGQASVAESEPEDTTPKPREISLFDKLFKPERAKENPKAQQSLSQEINTAPKEDPGLTVQVASGPQQNSILQEQNIHVDSQSAVQLQSSPANEDLQESKAKEETSKAAASSENHSVMSFFKTLVTPKSVPKADDEPKSDSEDKKKGNGTCKKAALPRIGIKAPKRHKAKGGQPVLQQKPETPTKMKSPESPKAGKSGFRRLFGLKPAKENQQTTETKSAAEPAAIAVAVKSEKAAPVQAVRHETKSPERAVKEQVPAPSEVQTDGPQKPSKESTPRAKLFWKKTVAEPEVQTVVMEAPVQAAAPTKDMTKTPESQKAKKPTFMNFFKNLPVSGDGGSTSAEEVNGKDPDQPTLDPTEGSATQKDKPMAPPVITESQPAAPKGKESAKEKKVATEQSKQKTNKQETKDSQEIASAVQQPLAQPQATQNGGDPTKEPALKRTEKRQSIGSFFKGIGTKKMCDAEVQTDPVSIPK